MKRKSHKSIVRKKQDRKNSISEEKIRLNKFIARNGFCSRREADKFIEAGVVTVNGKSVTRMGAKVSSLDIVKFNGIKIKSEPLRYILLNKPKNYSLRLTPNKKNTILNLIQRACKEHVAAVIPLNKMESGLLLFTNDDDLISKLSSNKQKIKTVYQITLNRNLSQEDFEHIKKGVWLNNKTSSPDLISYINGKNKNEVGVENSFGGIKLIKQIFNKLNYSVIQLDRVFLGGLTKKDLPRKHYRHLSQEEINILKRI